MSGNGAAGLIASGVWLSREDRTVLQGVSLEVSRGHVTALTAPSGAGKSTLLRCLTRLHDPDRGTITLDGIDVRALPPRELRRRVGLVAQRPVMLPGTVADNVAYGLPQPPTQDAVDGALAAAGLEPAFAPRRAADLSGGEQARVAIARAVIREPEVLLLDEPTAALDADTAAQLGATLQRLAASGLGVCLVTHDAAFADRYADRTAHLSEAA